MKIKLFTRLFSGFLVEFFSFPVVAGFTSAAALTIAASQFKTIFGITGKANEFLEALTSLFSNLDQIKLWDTVLGFSTFIALILARVCKIQIVLTCMYLPSFFVAIEKIWQLEMESRTI